MNAHHVICRICSVVATFGLLGASVGSAQSTAQVAIAPEAASGAAKVKVYALGPGITAPELIPLDAQPPVGGKCKKKLDGPVEFSLVIDAEGKSKNIRYLRTVGAPVDQLALHLVSTQMYKPGELNGVSAAVARSLQVDLHACVADAKDGNGKKTGEVVLFAQSEQRWTDFSSPSPGELNLTSAVPASGDKPLNIQPGGDISFPRMIVHVDPHFSEQAQKVKYQGITILSVTVDELGMPRDIRVVKALGMGLDEKAIEAVQQYRFSPAMEYGVAVPVLLTLQVDFRLYADPSHAAK